MVPWNTFFQVTYARKPFTSTLWVKRGDVLNHFDLVLLAKEALQTWVNLSKVKSLVRNEASTEAKVC